MANKYALEYNSKDLVQKRIENMKQNKKNKHQISVEKELKIVNRQEQSLRRSAIRQEVPKWKSALTEKVPEKIYANLQKAFCKAFEIVFEKGTGVIEKTYDRDSIQKDHEIHNFAFQVKADRNSLKKRRKDAQHSNLRNLAITSVEGFGLGALGIGLPDIVVFVGVLLKGIYEVSLRYGFDYDSREERYFILKLMETAVSKGNDWEVCNCRVDQLIAGGVENSQWMDAAEDQISRTANAFAVDMVLLKFIQGLPVVGMIGGAGNPVYYHKVMKYVELKYRKRYLVQLR